MVPPQFQPADQPWATLELADLPATAQLATRLANCLRPPMTLALVGTLGAGKTQLVRFLAEALGAPPESVTSPTYVLHQRYAGRSPMDHFDFYRLDAPAQVWDLGIDELYEQPGLVVIEWADKFPECLPDDHLQIHLETSSGTARTARLTPTGPRATQLVQCLQSG